MWNITSIRVSFGLFVGKLKSQLFNLSLILHKNQEMIFASEQVLKKQPCLVSVSLKGTDCVKPIVIKEIITCYRISLLISGLFIPVLWEILLLSSAYKNSLILMYLFCLNQSNFRAMCVRIIILPKKPQPKSNPYTEEQNLHFLMSFLEKTLYRTAAISLVSLPRSYIFLREFTEMCKDSTPHYFCCFMT